LKILKQHKKNETKYSKGQGYFKIKSEILIVFAIHYFNIRI
jgi:hypothetical protein